MKAPFIWSKTTVKLWNIITIYHFKIVKIKMYSCDAKLNFHHHSSSHQCHMILQKSCNMLILVLNKHFLLLSMFLIIIFVETLIHESMINIQ